MALLHFVVVYSCILSLSCFGDIEASQRPNIVLILTDDQDIELSGMDFMPKLKRLVTDQGTYFKNMFVTTPVCCSSRATILSGRYMHNHKVFGNRVADGCNNEHWRTKIEPTNFPVLLKKAGYKTFYSGKYLNKAGWNHITHSSLRKGDGEKTHVPPGYDFWAARLGTSKTAYFDYVMSVNGTMQRFGSTVDDYLTNTIIRHAKEFLKTIPPTAPHTPAQTIPPYENTFSNRRAPRTPHYGRYGKDKHWMIRNMPEKLHKLEVNQIDSLFRKRLRSLLPVDDMVQEVIRTLRKMEVLDNTYIIYTSDNGYHLGQFNLPPDKRQLYEFDVRVPLIVRGPGVQKRTLRNEPVLNLDLAPTILRMAKLPVPDYMDGQSFMNLLKSPVLRGNGWRKAFLIEYKGIGKTDEGCQANLGGHCFSRHPCSCSDAPNNTYSCIRIFTNNDDEIFCKFQDDENFLEYYNLWYDRHQLNNEAFRLPNLKVRWFEKKLSLLKQCSGKRCRSFSLK